MSATTIDGRTVLDKVHFSDCNVYTASSETNGDVTVHWEVDYGDAGKDADVPDFVGKRFGGEERFRLLLNGTTEQVGSNTVSLEIVGQDGHFLDIRTVNVHGEVASWGAMFFESERGYKFYAESYVTYGREDYKGIYMGSISDDLDMLDAAGAYGSDSGRITMVDQEYQLDRS